MAQSLWLDMEDWNSTMMNLAFAAKALREIQVQNLQNALTTWNEKLAEIWVLLTEEPEYFCGGDIWKVIVDIHGALQAIGIALLVLFFLAGMVKESGSFAEVKRP